MDVEELKSEASNLSIEDLGKLRDFCYTLAMELRDHPEKDLMIRAKGCDAYKGK